jgi:type IV pilus assembly protein PilO
MGEFLEQLDRIPTSQKILLLLLLSAGVVVAFYLLVYSSLEDEIAQTQQRISQTQDQRAEMKAQSNDISRLKSEIKGLCERQSTFLEKLPPRAEVGTLLQSIHQQAQLVGLQIERFENDDEIPSANYTTIPVKMNIRGTYDQIADFYYFIGRQQRIVNVKNISLSADKSGSTATIDGVPVVASVGLGPAASVGRTNAAVAAATSQGGASSQNANPRVPRLAVSFQVQTYFADISTQTGGKACAKAQ